MKKGEIDKIVHTLSRAAMYLVIFAAFHQRAHAQVNTVKILDDSTRQILRSFSRTDDGGYLICGTNQPEYEFHYWFSRLDSNLNQLWVREVLSNSTYDVDSAHNAIQTSDHGYLLVYRDEYTFNYHRALRVLKLDANFNILWHERLGDNGHIRCSSLIESNGSYIMAGEVLNEITGVTSPFIWKHSVAGGSTWMHTYITGYTTNYTGAMMVENSNRITVCGTSITTPNKILYFSVDSMGNVLQSRIISTDNNSNIAARAMCRLQNGTNIILGSMDSSTNDRPALFIAINDSQQIIQTKVVYSADGGTYTRMDGRDIMATGNGEAVAAGHKLYNYTTAYNKIDAGWVLCMDSALQIKWHKEFNGYSGDEFDHLAPFKNGQIVMAGKTESFGYPEYEPGASYPYFSKILIATSPLQYQLGNYERADSLAEAVISLTIDTIDLTVGPLLTSASLTPGTTALYTLPEYDVCPFTNVATFEKVTGFGDYYSDGDAIQTSDRGFLFCHTNTLDKFDHAGNVVWTRSYSNYDSVSAGDPLIELSDKTVFSKGNYGTIAIFDTLGFPLSAHCFELNPTVAAVGKMHNDSIVLVLNKWYHPVTIAILDPHQGTIVNNKELIFPEFNPGIECIRETHDGGFIMSGSQSDWWGPWGGAIIRLDKYLNVLWAKRYFDSEDLYFNSVIEDHEHNFIVVGKHIFWNGDSAVIARFDSLGNLMWAKYVGDEEGSSPLISFSVLELPDETILVNIYRDITGPNTGSLLVKLNLDGNVIWSKSNYGMSQHIKKSVDGGLVFSGTSGDEDPSLYLAHLDINGNGSGCIHNEEQLWFKPVVWQLDNLEVSIANGVYSTVPIQLNQPISYDNTEAFLCTCPQGIPGCSFSPVENNDTINFINNSANFTSCYWDFGDSTTSTAINPIHVYSLPGLYHVCLSTYNACAENTTCQYVQATLNTGINDNSENGRIKVYPNPATNVLYVYGNNCSSDKLEITVSSLNGTTMIQKNESVGKTGIIQIELHEVPAGVYFVTVKTSSFITVTKVIIQK